MERVRVTRRFQADCEKVFDAWLDPGTAGNWLYATPDGKMVRVEIDARVGGSFEIVERRDGEDVLHTGTYEELERPRRLVFTLQVPKYSQDKSRVAIDLAPAEGGDGCELSLDAGEETAEDAAKYRKGWSTVLEGLARQLGEDSKEAQG